MLRTCSFDLLSVCESQSPCTVRRPVELSCDGIDRCTPGTSSTQHTKQLVRQSLCDINYRLIGIVQDMGQNIIHGIYSDLLRPARGSMKFIFASF